MAIITDGCNRILIDRTFIELITGKKDFSQEIVANFCKNLKKIGVDLLEVNSTFLAKLSTPLSIDIPLVVRIDSIDDFKISATQKNIKFILISNLNLLGYINNYHHHKIIFECQGNEIEEIKILSKQLKRIDGNVDLIRIKGLSRYMAEDWRVLSTEISREQQVKIDICPQNEYGLSTAVALDLLSCSPEVFSLSTTFTGIGGFTPLEEVIMAAKVLKDYDTEDLSILPALKKSFEHLTGELIAPDKPIIGENIFKYESGIHADGIAKNPLTYEPFEPAMVGLARKLVIGKHSGTKALIAKLKELEISFGEEDIEEILNKVKKMSITLKREISDSELVNICLDWEQEERCNREVGGI